MGSATFLIGLLPAYATAGLWSPLLPTGLRLVQGFCVGGEWGGATLMAVEHAPRGKKGLFGAFPQMGAPAGVSLATLSFLLVSNLDERQFLAWGWRVPFLLSALLVAVGLTIRLSVAESPEFVRMREAGARLELPVVQAFRLHAREIFTVAGVYLSQGVFAYISMSYLVSYATRILHVDRTLALAGVFVSGMVATLLYGGFGALSDRIGRKTTYLLGAVAMGLSIGPALLLIDTGTARGFSIALVLVFGIAMAPAGGVTGPLFSSLFAPEVRYTGTSIGYTISQILGSALAPMIATILYAATGSTVGLFVYLIAISIVSVVSVILLPGPWGREEARTQDKARPHQAVTALPADASAAVDHARRDPDPRQ